MEQESSGGSFFYSSSFASPWFFGELLEAVKNAPTYHVIVEVLLIALVLRLWFFNSYKIEREELTSEEEEQIIRDWVPEPLVPEKPTESEFYEPVNENIISGAVGKTVTINEKECLDLATLNFLGLIGDARIEEAAIECLHKYGVGSCGPRGFYGTIDVHLNLEHHLATFMGVEEAIIYSYGFAAVASAIAAYAKKGDIIFVDEAANFAIQQGVTASRSKVKWFKHNDMEDLEQLLKEQAIENKGNPKKAKVTRLFIVAEGLYFNTGNVCPLPKLIELKYAYKVRIFLDETYSFGVFGATGKGVTEHFDCDVSDIDLICGSLENSLGSVGGFCCGSSFVVDHQRLSGSGYCFSASAPPLLSVSASKALDIIQSEPERLSDLRQNAVLVQEMLEGFSGLTCISEPESPLKILTIDDQSKTFSECNALLTAMRDTAIEQGFVIVRVTYLRQFEAFRHKPALRVCVKHNTTKPEIEEFGKCLKEIWGDVRKKGGIAPGN